MPPPPSSSELKNSTSSANENTDHNNVRAKKQSPILLWVGLCCIVSGAFNIINAHWLHSSEHHGPSLSKKKSVFRNHHRGGAIHNAMQEFLKGKEKLKAKQEAQVEGGKDSNPQEKAHPPVPPQKQGQGHLVVIDQPPKPAAKTFDNWGDAAHPDTLATLSCEAHGGPSTAEAQEMVYWHDIPSDTKYTSPLFRSDGVERYLTFEPDGGGKCGRWTECMWGSSCFETVRSNPCTIGGFDHLVQAGTIFAWPWKP